MSGAHEGDDQLLKVIIAYFEMRGLTVCAAQDYLGDQTGKPGSQTGMIIWLINPILTVRLTSLL